MSVKLKSTKGGGKRAQAASASKAKSSSARGRGSKKSPGRRVGSTITRAREAAGYDLFGGSIDSDDYLYRAAGEGPRDLPSYTHDRQIELAFGLYELDPLAKRIIDLRKDYVVADGITYEIAQSEAECEAERAAQAEKAKAAAQRKATIARAQIGALLPSTATAGARAPGSGPAGPAPSALPPTDGSSLRAVQALPAAGAGSVDVADPADAADADQPTTEELRAVLDRHWNDPDNNWPLKQHDRVIGFGVWGEQCYPVFVDPASGHAKLGWVDPRRIKEVRTDPENRERVVAVALRPLATEQVGKVYRVIHVHEAAEAGAASDLDGYLVGAGKDEVDDEGNKYDGACFYFAVNRIQGAKRGHSDLLPVIDWIDAYTSLLFNGIDAAAQKNAFIWDVLLTGADDAAIAEFKRKNGRAPKPGAVRIHNENVTWTAVSPDLGASQHDTFNRMYRVYILGAMGLPEHWFGEGDSATRATASEMSAPVLRTLKSRQMYVCATIQEILRFQVDQAILAGEIKGTPETKLRVTVQAPEFESTDVVNGAAALAQGSNALAVAEDRGWITRDTARKGFATIAKHLGMTIDADAEKDAIEAQDAAEAEQAQANLQVQAKQIAGGTDGGVPAGGVIPPRGGPDASGARAAEGWPEVDVQELYDADELGAIMRAIEYDPSQPRDELGMWTSGGTFYPIWRDRNEYHKANDRWLKETGHTLNDNGTYTNPDGGIEMRHDIIARKERNEELNRKQEEAAAARDKQQADDAAAKAAAKAEKAKVDAAKPRAVRRPDREKPMPVPAEHELPKITGSEKQIAWAKDIRAKALVHFEIGAAKKEQQLAPAIDAGKLPAEDVEKYRAEVDAARKRLHGISSARAWIDSRGSGFPDAAIQRNIDKGSYNYGRESDRSARAAD